MNELLNALYEELSAPQLKTEIKRCHQEFIVKLDNPERRRVLQIIDCNNQIVLKSF